MTATRARENKIRGSSRNAAPGTATAGPPMIGVGPSKHEAEEADLNNLRCVREARVIPSAEYLAN